MAPSEQCGGEPLFQASALSPCSVAIGVFPLAVRSVGCKILSGTPRGIPVSSDAINREYYGGWVDDAPPSLGG